MTGRGSTARAAMWALLATAGTRIISLVALAVLARFLAPREFGLLAFALVYITYAETVGDLGTGVALIYWPNRRDDAAQVTFIVNVAMGLFWSITTFFLAPHIAAFFKNPDATAIVQVLSLSFLIKFLGNTHDALAQKDLRFRARLVPEVGLALVKAAISIALAAAGFGAWSMVWGHLGGITVWTIGSWLIVRWRPRAYLPRDLLRPMLGYGRGIVGVNMLAAVVHHADLAVVGRMLGATALGLFQIADKIPEACITVVIWVVSKVLFPAFARLQSSVDQLRGAYLKALNYVSLVTIPIAAGLFFVADPLVRLFFGPQWLAAIPLMRWLAIYSGVRSLGTQAGDVLKATGRTGMLTLLAVVKAAVLIPALILAARSGLEAVARTEALVTAAIVMMNIGIVMRQLRFGLFDLFRALRPSLLAGLAMSAVCLPLQSVDADPETRLILIVAAGAAAYALMLFIADRRLFLEVIDTLPLRRRGRGDTSAE